MKRFVLLAVFIFISCSFAFAQEITAPSEVTTTTTAPATSSKPRFDIGAGYWYTWSSLDLKLYADQDYLYSLQGDKVSELNYDLDGGLFVINADAYLFWRLYADGFVGLGDVDSGELVDSDWLWQLTTEKMYEATIDAAGDVTTWNANAYIRILEEEDDKGYLDLGVGYLYYQDDIEHLTDGVFTIYYWETADLAISSDLDSSDKYTFDGLRLGARAKIRFHDRIAVKASGGIVPWLGVEKEWNWNLAGHHGDGEAEGTAIDLDIAIEFKITKNLFIEAGYKYINLDSDNGDLTWIYDDGTIVETADNWNVDADRGGFYAMGRLKI